MARSKHDWTGTVRLAENLGQAESKAVAAALAAWSAHNNVGRLWAHDKRLWTGADEDKWLGWLDIATRERADVAALDAVTRAATARRDVVLIGMGGSSLGPDVIARGFGHREGWPRFHMLDSTDPAQIAAIEHAIDPANTLFIVSSKSGTTLEPNILEDYFFARVGAEAGSQFVAVTDPGSAMEKKARQRGFAQVFFGDPQIGGRYSVLSKFGLVPATAIGVDVAGLLDATETMARLCQGAGEDNPGLRLGLALGTLAKEFRRDKVTILTSPRIASLGSWLEQLIAESTGKQGKGLVPVDSEPVAAPDDYGNDRVFIYVALSGDDDDSQSNAIDVLALAGHPVLRLAFDDMIQLGQVFFLAEIATAVAGAVIGINPFDQPDVEASKVKTRALTDAYEKSGTLPTEKPFFETDGIALFADAENEKALAKGKSLAEILRTHIARAGAGDYLALLAYIERNAEHTAILTALRVALRHAAKCATCVGFGPRFLHSTGQAYKGGPNSGVFLQITADPAHDLAVPGKKYSFGLVEAAQAQGDFAVLTERKRRALRVHLSNVDTGLGTLVRAVHESLTR
ncbi:MAG TPA: bifunctional transaldolase/phosoglucose isomerase [Stellaceae bacterium]|nr:bifunctional transaldolase/phosoglucose isomerase [Stellaceae bacterium]